MIESSGSDTPATLASSVPVSGPVSVTESEPVSVPPTLGMAFVALCEAMSPSFQEAIPDLLRCREIQGWYVNGNHIVAWSEAIRLLEQVLGTPLRP